MSDRDVLRGAVACLLLVTAWIVYHAFAQPSSEMTEFAAFAITLNAIIIYTFRHQLRGPGGKK